MSDPTDMSIAVRVTAPKFEQLKREASRKGITVSEYAGQLMHGRDGEPGAARSPSFEDVRLMIREEIRSALREERATDLQFVGAHCHTGTPRRAD